MLGTSASCSTIWIVARSAARIMPSDAARHARGINEMLSGILRAAEGEDLLDKVPRPLAR